MTTVGSDITELPPYHALFVVDMRGFGRVPGRHHAEVTNAIPTVLRHAFQRCGLDWVWETARFQGTTGDGYYLGFDSRYAPFLLNPLLSALQDELAFQNSLMAHPIKLRVSINVGPLTDEEAESLSRGSGAARVETHRLLDSESVRAVLDNAGPETCVAAIVSERVFDDVVAPGYSADGTGLYHWVEANEKEYHGSAYLRVPTPSGRLLAHGFGNVPDTDPDSSQGSASGTGPDATHRAGTPTTARVDGPVAQHGSRVNTGVDVSGSGHTVTTVHGDQHQGPSYHGHGQIHIAGTNSGPIHQNTRGGGTR